MAIKEGPYGTYYEWIKDTVVCRCSINDYTFTEDDCIKMSNGEKVKFRRKEIRGNGFVEGKATITSYKNKKGTTSYKIKEFEANTIYDSDIIKEAIASSKIHFTGDTIKAISAIVTEQLKEINTAKKYKASYTNACYVDDKTSIFRVFIAFDNSTISSEYDAHICDKYYYVRDDIVEKEIDSNEYNMYRKKAHEDYLKELEKEKEKEKLAREEAEKERIANILKTPWTEITIEDYRNNEYSDYEEIETILNERYLDKDINHLVLFKIKQIRQWSSNSHRTIDDQGGSVYYIGEVLPGITLKHIKSLKAFPIASCSIREYKWEHDDTVEYILDYTLHGTD